MNELTANFDDNLLDDGLKLFFTIVKAETGKVLRILSRLLSNKGTHKDGWESSLPMIPSWNFSNFASKGVL